MQAAANAGDEAQIPTRSHGFRKLARARRRNRAALAHWVEPAVRPARHLERPQPRTRRRRRSLTASPPLLGNLTLPRKATQPTAALRVASPDRHVPGIAALEQRLQGRRSFGRVLRLALLLAGELIHGGR